MVLADLSASFFLSLSEDERGDGIILVEVFLMAQYVGTVKLFNNARGYGFLNRDFGSDVFVHYSSMQHDGYKSLKEGDAVEIDVIQGNKGPQADRVVRSPSDKVS